MISVPFQNYSIQPACKIWRCGAQGDDSVWAASWSTLHEQWGTKDGWCAGKGGPAAYLFSLCLTEDFLVCSFNVIFRFSFSGASFLNSSNSAISLFYYMGGYIAMSIPSAHWMLVALILHGGIRYAIRVRAYIVSFTFCRLSFSFQHSLSSRGFSRAGEVWKTGG